MAQGKFAALAEFVPARAEFKPRAGFGGSVRKQGKRTNPDYNQYSVLLTKASWRLAQAELHTNEYEIPGVTGRPDFSDLMQSLLDKWLEKRK